MGSGDVPKNLEIDFFDARTGNLLVTGRWQNSAFHGFQNAATVTREVMAEMFAKLKGAGTQVGSG